MIPAAFEYERASSADEAVSLLAEHGDDAKVLAGGHSLLPLMKLRLATPGVLVDVGRLSELSYVRDEGAHLTVGALTTHHDLATSPVAASGAPMLAHVASQIGDPQVRHRGTIGGSMAHGDPASDLPGAALALDATFVVRGTGGQREVPAPEFFRGFLETALAPDELLTEIRVPKTRAGWSFQKFNIRAQDWAIVGVAALWDASPRVALVNMAPRPIRAYATEEALAAGSSVAEASALAASGSEPSADKNATAEFRSHLATVLVRRALEEAGGERATR